MCVCDVQMGVPMGVPEVGIHVGTVGDGCWQVQLSPHHKLVPVQTLLCSHIDGAQRDALCHKQNLYATYKYGKHTFI